MTWRIREDGGNEAILPQNYIGIWMQNAASWWLCAPRVVMLPPLTPMVLVCSGVHRGIGGGGGGRVWYWDSAKEVYGGSMVGFCIYISRQGDEYVSYDGTSGSKILSIYYITFDFDQIDDSGRERQLCFCLAVELRAKGI